MNPPLGMSATTRIVTVLVEGVEGPYELSLSTGILSVGDDLKVSISLIQPTHPFFFVASFPFPMSLPCDLEDSWSSLAPLFSREIDHP